MSSLDPTTALPPLPSLKSFALTHILYDPTQYPLISIPLTLLSLSPIFLFVSYFTLLIFERRLTLLLLALGSLANEMLSWGLKRVWKGERPYVGMGEVGSGYGMPSSHTQAAAFLVSWGLGYVWTMERRRGRVEGRRGLIRRWRTGVYFFGLILWSILVAYSRWHLLYHTPLQILAGYIVGLVAGSVHFALTEYIPLHHPQSIPARLRSTLAGSWEGIGGISGWNLGGAEGGWGEGSFLLDSDLDTGRSYSQSAFRSPVRKRGKRRDRSK